MPRKPPSKSGAACLLVLLGSVALLPEGAPAPRETGQQGEVKGTISPTRRAGPAPIDFQRHVQPLLAARCARCHDERKRRGGLLLTSRRSALLPADSGVPAVVPGDSAGSEMIRRIG